MIYFLGGPPKVGKSTISGKIRQKHAVSVVSTDSLGAMLENVWSDETAPALFVKDKFSKLSQVPIEQLKANDFAEHLNYVIKESHSIWNVVIPFIKRENEEGRDVLIEGVGVLPELVHRLDDIPYQVVFIGNQRDNHADNIKKAAEVNKYDWMHGRSDQYITIFAAFVNRMSVYVEQEAKKYGFAYIELDQKLFTCLSDEIINALKITGR